MTGRLVHHKIDTEDYDADDFRDENLNKLGLWSTIIERDISACTEQDIRLEWE